jgi:hypothetical protein
VGCGKLACKLVRLTLELILLFVALVFRAYKLLKTQIQRLHHKVDRESGERLHLSTRNSFDLARASVILIQLEVFYLFAREGMIMMRSSRAGASTPLNKARRSSTFSSRDGALAAAVLAEADAEVGPRVEEEEGKADVGMGSGAGAAVVVGGWAEVSGAAVAALSLASALALALALTRAIIASRSAAAAAAAAAGSVEAEAEAGVGRGGSVPSE